MRAFDINSDKAIILASKLERVHKSALPSAVRNTLNNAAFETKKNIPIEASKKFITRQKTFFKRFSTVEKANGFNTKNMAAIVGIDGRRNMTLAKNLESQEKGGKVKGKKLIPHDHSRTSKSLNKRVSSKNFLNKVNVHHANRAYQAHRGTRNSKFIAAVMSTAKSGKKHMMLTTGNSGMVYELSSLTQNRRSRKINFKLKKLYTVRSKKTHTVKSNYYVRKSADIASGKISLFFNNNAEFQLKKHLK